MADDTFAHYGVQDRPSPLNAEQEAQRGEEALARLDKLLAAAELPYMLVFDIKTTVSAYGIARELHAIAALRAAGRA